MRTRFLQRSQNPKKLGKFSMAVAVTAHVFSSFSPHRASVNKLFEKQKIYMHEEDSWISGSMYNFGFQKSMRTPAGLKVVSQSFPSIAVVNFSHVPLAHCFHFKRYWVAALLLHGNITAIHSKIPNFNCSVRSTNWKSWKILLLPFSSFHRRGYW